MKVEICSPAKEKVKLIFALFSAAIGATLIVFAGISAHYKDIVSAAEERYLTVAAALVTERDRSDRDLRQIIRRLDQIEQEIRTIKENPNVGSHQGTSN